MLCGDIVVWAEEGCLSVSHGIHGTATNSFMATAEKFLVLILNFLLLFSHLICVGEFIEAVGDKPPVDELVCAAFRPYSTTKLIAVNHGRSTKMDFMHDVQVFSNFSRCDHLSDAPPAIVTWHRWWHRFTNQIFWHMMMTIYLMEIMLILLIVASKIPHYRKFSLGFKNAFNYWY